ncbi:hypothetical protein, partial [Bradyrhizobium ivorense]|uniref:hypothetical protein n=1 Tax=Bradyrhizobium ivorense TaxID=2511166 RepID=UPI001E549531
SVIPGRAEPCTHPPLSSPGLCAIAHIDRAIQYAAASRFYYRRLWNTGSPAFAGDDTEQVEPTNPTSFHRCHRPACAQLRTWTGRSSTPRPFGSITTASGIPDHPLSRVMTPNKLNQPTRHPEDLETPDAQLRV